MSIGELTSRDHDEMDNFLGKILDSYKNGQLDKVNAVSILAQVIAAIDQRNYAEARNWLSGHNPVIDEQ